VSPEHMPQPKKPRLVFTDLQRRTLQAIFKVSGFLMIF
jgi:nuclear factor 6 (one cut domain family protein 1)